MRRRSFLRVISAGAAPALAGCLPSNDIPPIVIQSVGGDEGRVTATLEMYRVEEFDPVFRFSQALVPSEEVEVTPPPTVEPDRAYRYEITNGVQTESIVWPYEPNDTSKGLVFEVGNSTVRIVEKR